MSKEEKDCDRKRMLEEAKVYNNDELHIDLWYPRNASIKSLVVGLMDVRAADSIRVSYDFKRDGWRIEQASRFEWEDEDDVCDHGWQEVSFIQAWGREEETDESTEI